MARLWPALVLVVLGLLAVGSEGRRDVRSLKPRRVKLFGVDGGPRTVYVASTEELLSAIKLNTKHTTVVITSPELVLAEGQALDLEFHTHIKSQKGLKTVIKFGGLSAAEPGSSPIFIFGGAHVKFSGITFDGENVERTLTPTVDVTGVKTKACFKHVTFINIPAKYGVAAVASIDRSALLAHVPSVTYSNVHGTTYTIEALSAEELPTLKICSPSSPVYVATGSGRFFSTCGASTDPMNGTGNGTFGNVTDPVGNGTGNGTYGNTTALGVSCTIRAYTSLGAAQPLPSSCTFCFA